MFSTNTVSNLQLDKKAVFACPLCLSKKRFFMYAATEHEYDNTTDEVFSFYRCTDCTLVYIDPRPDDSSLEIIYPHNYYSKVSLNSSPSDLNLNSFIGRILHKRLINRITPNISPFIKISKNTKFLDIGCGGGRSLASIYSEFKCNVTGIDVDIPDSVVEQFNKPPITLIKNNFFCIDFKDQKFDIVYASHLIEHLENPNNFLKKVSNILNPGGICVIETPNENCFARKLFGRFWGGNHVPRHWFLLNPKTAANVLEYDENIDLKLLHVRFSHNSAFWIWSFHALFTSILGRKFADLLFPSDQRIISVSIPNLLKHTFFTYVDIILGKIFKTTGNMSIIYRKKC